MIETGKYYEGPEIGRLRVGALEGDAWHLLDVSTGAKLYMSEDTILSLTELIDFQPGQTWIDLDDDTNVVKLVSLVYLGCWRWNVERADGTGGTVAEEALRNYYARVDGLSLDAPAAAPPRACRNCDQPVDGHTKQQRLFCTIQGGGPI